MTQTEARPQVPAQVASDGRMDLRQGGSQDAGQDEQDGRQGQADAHSDGLSSWSGSNSGPCVGLVMSPVYTRPWGASSTSSPDPRIRPPYVTTGRAW